MIKNIKNYFWFLKESQLLMKGMYHPIVIFILSLGYGIDFCKLMNRYYKIKESN